MTETTPTTLGAISYKVSDKATSIDICGINCIKELQVRVWTSKDKRSGYIIYAHIPTGKCRYERIRVAYIDAHSAAKYGRKAITETLPILKT